MRTTRFFQTTFSVGIFLIFICAFLLWQEPLLSARPFPYPTTSAFEVPSLDKGFHRPGPHRAERIPSPAHMRTSLQP
ncbi:MAG: hypothetical protein AAFR61_12630 [Bacteroidota bacterium]